jgi:hypothetical protein
MRAQNEPAERVVRLNRRKSGHVEGRPDRIFPTRCTSSGSTRRRFAQD